MIHPIVGYIATHKVEIAGALITWLGIWLTARRLLACWPVVLAADVLYLVVFYEARLYSDALLQGLFIAFTLYGWWHWRRGLREDGEVRVASLTWRSMILALALGAVGSVVLGMLMARVGAALPHLDAALTSYSLVGSWWQARKNIANWWLWIVVNAIYVGEYIYKDLLVTAGLYAVLIVLAAIGLRDWRHAEKAQAEAALVAAPQA